MSNFQQQQNKAGQQGQQNQQSQPARQGGMKGEPVDSARPDARKEKQGSQQRSDSQLPQDTRNAS